MGLAIPWVASSHGVFYIFAGWLMGSTENQRRRKMLSVGVIVLNLGILFFSSISTSLFKRLPTHFPYLEKS